MAGELTGRKVLILGGGHHQVPMVETAQKLGMCAIVCDADPQAYCRTHCDIFYPISFTEIESLVAIIRDLKIDGVSTIGTNQAIYWAAVLKERTGLPSKIDAPHLVKRAIKKNLWRSVLEDADINVPYGVSASSPQELQKQYRRQADVPVILKPGDGSGGKGVRLVESWKEFDDLFELTRQSSMEGVVIAEEFIDGTVIGVESITEQGHVQVVGIADKQMSPLPHFATLGVVAPTGLSVTQQDAVCRANESTIHALGLTNGPSHIDMIVRDHKVYVIDIGCRLAGGPVVFEIMRHCYATCLIEATLRQAVGLTAKVSPKWQGHYRGSRHWPAERNGRLAHIRYASTDLEKFGVTYQRFWKHPGDLVSATCDDTSMLGSFACRGATRLETLDRLDGYMRRVEFAIES